MCQTEGPGIKAGTAGMECHQGASVRPRWHLTAAATSATEGLQTLQHGARASCAACAEPRAATWWMQGM